VRERASVADKPILVVSAEATTAEHVVERLRRLGRVAVAIETSPAAIEMMQVIDFGLVIVDVQRPSDWHTCQRVTGEATCAVAVISHLLARDRRYRDRAFRMGVAAYITKPCTRRRLREALARIESGQTAIEVLGPAAAAGG
jgi:CheY-like chemotaxis protein